MKKCFVITSYCDTELKRDVLNKSIDNLKQFNIDILLHAHYPIPIHIQDKINYYIYDYSNPILSTPKSMLVFWRKIKNFRMEIFLDDYGYTVLQAWRRSFDFLKSIGYEQILIINYDVIIEQGILDILDDNLEYKDVCLFYWENNSLNCAMAGIKTDLDLDFINEEEYIKMSGFAEDFIHNKFNKKLNCAEVKHDSYKEHFYTMIGSKNQEYKINRLPTPEEDGTPWDIYNMQKCKIHIGELDSKLNVLFFDIKENINIKIKTKNSEFTANIEDDVFIYPTFNNEQIEEIRIDDNKLDDNIIDSFRVRKAIIRYER